jgi:hypothetical protein
MFFRVIFGAIVGGALAFGGGALSHAVLKLSERQMAQPVEPLTVKEDLAKHFPKPGVYFFPTMPMDPNMTKEEKDAAFEKYKEEFKTGQGAFISIAPTGQEFDMMKFFVPEIITNVVGAFLISLVIAMTRPGLGFGGRWIAVLLIGVFSWVSINTSYHIWYRFPQEWVLDELYCALIEWALAGLAIAAIVKPKRPDYGY